MTTTELPRAGGRPGAARTALALVILAQAAMLALPAAVYLWKYPDLPNALSLALSLGFFCAIFTLVRPVWLQVLIGLPILLLNMVEIVHIVAFGGLISLGAVEAVFYVDPMEAREFATEHAGLFLLGGLVVAFFCVLAWFKKKLDDLRLGQRLMIGSAALLVPFGLLTAELIAFGSERDIYLPTRILEHYTAYLGVNPLTHTISGFAATLASQDELLRLKAERDRFSFKARREAGRPAEEVYIVVIGESSRRRNWSLFGYKRPTNPLLGATPGLIAFSDALSPASTTGRSLPLSLSFATA
ncbi:MAG: hypothetical protein Q8Q62_06835, partial [Mesorhizobium sp.]|nr:hypothetical protein [Mesorhizobium sp.]